MALQQSALTVDHEFKKQKRKFSSHQYISKLKFRSEKSALGWCTLNLACQNNENINLKRMFDTLLLFLSAEKFAKVNRDRQICNDRPPFAADVC